MLIPLLKKSAILPIFLIFSVVAVTVPLRASAEPYIGELQLQNTSILPDYGQARPYISKNTQVNPILAAGYAYPTINDFNGSYAGWPATFTPLENNNFISSQTQKNFSASIENDVLNCTGDDIKLVNNSIALTYVAYDDVVSTDPLCLPIYPAAQNTTTTLNNSGSGNSYGGLGVVQSYDMLPLPSLGEAEQITSVESLPNDPDNVRVTVTDNYIQEIYAVHFTRQGDVWNVYNFVPVWAQYPEYGAFVKDGKTYVLNWLSNWVGQVPISLNDDYGTTIWGDPSTYFCDYENGSCTMDPLYVNTGYPTPRISQLAATSVSASSSVIRPRNSDVISVTQPRCTRGGSDGFWSSTVWVSCETYGLSADGRVGTANYYNQQSSRGWGFTLFALALVVVGLSFGVDFGGILFGSAGFGGITAVQALATLGGQVGSNLVLNSASPAAVAAVGALAAATLQTVATSPTPLGTVERSNGLGVGSWSWNPSSPPIPTPPVSVVSVPTISVTSPTTDQTVVQGGTLNISWSSQNAPDGSAVVLSLVNTVTGTNLGIVARNQTTTGNTSWNLPAVGARALCADCGGIQEMVPVGTYKIVAKIYTPSDAWFGDTPQPVNPVQPTYLASGDSNAFTVLNPAPSITSISPNSAVAGAGSALMVNGTNFVPSSVINFNGVAKTTSFVSTSQLTASILASDVAAAGAYPVTVTNPSPGGGTSDPPQTFTVTTPPPPLPSCVFSASPSAIVPPQSSSLSWNCSNANSCSIDNGIGSVGVNGSSTVKPSQTTTYTLSCNGSGGSASFQTTVRTTRFDIREVAP
ncbi:MAG: IPT/TIG domain-containing protein [bacterium]|nr:IPT/TIG domain-containing protein [bacterium]